MNWWIIAIKFVTVTIAKNEVTWKLEKLSAVSEISLTKSVEFKIWNSIVLTIGRVICFLCGSAGDFQSRDGIAQQGSVSEILVVYLGLSKMAVAMFVSMTKDYVFVSVRRT